ncbi:anthranilate n-hydroxycinnamoyl/benzoyltransferase [Grosmannia clavigera kw1407]|uniref:Anthranilate n-hydroxycinnamoyl/benzoyltransferase n=1 Tax=Grosmannia clavigera (strain kw1407 / UAMH 11150) TaxID=655863 RepID=F0XP55_GROCL|nr:anthranilate n-hydroxycinnamoyl/benzoyltransferase [Grosmannia clavigera kw1407]EFX00145.1 anthranilate n-hydroxycinnamoyl/benzoyltransferase [Grosmannia clavigera kw1407]
MRVQQQKPASSLCIGSCPCDKKTTNDHTITRLPAWDQASMRSYIRVVLCFAFDNTAIDAAVQHIRGSLKRLACQRPAFSGSIEVHAGGIVHLRTSNKPQLGEATIPFTTVDISSKFPYASFDELKEASFPPAAFVAPHFNQPCVVGEGLPGVPVAVVKAFIIPGGLLLGIYFNHAVADGDCLRVFLEAFAGQTCHQPSFGPSTMEHHVPLSRRQINGTDIGLEKLLERIPEYSILDEPLGPTMPRLRAEGVPMDEIPKIGKIFVFNNERLNELRSFIAAESSRTQKKTGTGCCRPLFQNGDVGANYINYTNYTCLAALTWAHITRARLADKNRYVPYSADLDETALLQTMVNWKTRAFKEKNKDYFGNATAVAATQVPTRAVLVEAASDRSRLAELVATIDKTISSVDEDYVRDRTEFFTRVPDPRLIGLRFDPRTPQDLGFNTWRFFGSDTKWTIPGVGSGSGRGATSPDVVRRMQDAWNMSGALILPAKAGSTAHELLVTLPTSSMELLCQDQDWMCWVDRVIG